MAPNIYHPKIVKKRILGSYENSERFTMAEVFAGTGNAVEVPGAGHYKLPDFEHTRQRSRMACMHAQSENEKRVAEKRWARTNQPSPHTYTTHSAFNFQSTV